MGERMGPEAGAAAGGEILSAEDLERLEACDTLEGLYAWAHAFALRLGFQETFFAHVGPTGSVRPEDGAVIFDGRNPEWVEVYQKRRFKRVDDAVKRGWRGQGFYFVERPSGALNAEQEAFYQMAERFNRLNGVCVPFPHRSGSLSGFAAYGHDGVITPRTARALKAGVSVCVDRVVEFLSSRAADVFQVSPRERLYLRCLADGLNHRETAKHLDVTEDWAHKTFARLRDKFAAGTDAALLIKASQNGLLDRDDS